MPRVRKAAAGIEQTLSAKPKETKPKLKEQTTETQIKDSKDWVSLLSNLPDQQLSTGIQNVRITRSRTNKLQQSQQLVRKLFESTTKSQQRTNMSDSEGDQGAFGNQTYVKPPRGAGARLPKNTHPPYLQMIQGKKFYIL